MRRSLTVAALAGCAAIVGALPAHAGLADLIPGLFDRDIFLAPPTGNFPSHETHFLDERDALRGTGLGINQALASQLGTFPLPSPSGGFTYRFDPATGALVRSTDSFGPLFMERAQTIGDGQWNLGISYQQASYSTLDDVDLGDGSIEFQLRHQDNVPFPDRESPFFEGDLINVNLFLDVETRTTVFFASYGVNDRFDLSLGIPVVSVDLDARAQLTIDRLSTEGITGIHRFPDGSDQMTFAADDSATGIGDVLARAKVRFWESDTAGLAALIDLRLPTGDEEDLLGTGVTQAKIAGVGSWTFGRFSPHLNAGYTLSSGDSDAVGELPDEINYALGFDVAATPRLTINAEVIGRVLQDATVIERRQETFRFARQNGTVGSVDRPVVHLAEDDQNLLLGVAGLRFNPVGNLLVSLAGLFDLGSDGLQNDDATFVLSLDTSF